ncbi:MAG: acetyl-CoA carboxylase carboxyl transferase subunit beta [Chloroflexi bacterium]|jgi:acetyl-CoA carboxylase carboxyl transferase beta subunit/acetyl-CoA carboxylase carboxyl transferase alpha subunit|nr:MAG: acetyl-CoA carboxylase carboxyl transferase subunit beta [Chloroflexota bacterium]|tara:strand:- start:236 stop:2029 length:1794 start_codon:yes stop_codon:yes gene_type:complete
MVSNIQKIKKIIDSFKTVKIKTVKNKTVKIIDSFKTVKIKKPADFSLKCSDCKLELIEDSGYLSLGICSNCGHHDVLTAKQWIQILFDPNSFNEKFINFESPDPLHFNDSKPYKERIKSAKQNTGEQSAVTTGITSVRGKKVIAVIFNFKFMGGSMGYVVGERINSTVENAIRNKIPLVIVTCSGGARMQEGTLALTQMIKTTNAINKLHKAGLPLIVILANPTTGGVYASFANQADILIAEEKALIGFAGPRVRAVNSDEKDRIFAEQLFDNGLIDIILSRKNMRDYLERVLNVISANTMNANTNMLGPKIIQSTNQGWDSVTNSRKIDRPGAIDYIQAIFSDFLELRGDRNGTNDEVLIGGFAKVALKNVMVIGQNKYAGDSEITKGRVTAAGYRKATRIISIANRLKLPIICFIDTPGANDSLDNEMQGLANAISDTIAALSNAAIESISIIIGEGGSGGAIALCCTDQILMQENAFLAITSPEGAASILYRDKKYAEDVANALGITAMEHKKLGFVDEIIAEPHNGASTNKQEAIRLVYESLINSLIKLENEESEKRIEARDRKWINLGKNQKFSSMIQGMLLGITRKMKVRN